MNSNALMNVRLSSMCAHLHLVTEKASGLCGNLSYISHLCSFREACQVQPSNITVYCNLFWETSAWFILPGIEVSHGFHPLHISASVAVFITHQKVCIESATTGESKLGKSCHFCHCYVTEKMQWRWDVSELCSEALITWTNNMEMQ